MRLGKTKELAASCTSKKQTHILLSPKLARAQRHLTPKAAAMGIATAAPSQPAIQVPLAGFLQRVRECNAGMEELSSLIPFNIGAKRVGHLKPE